METISASNKMSKRTLELCYEVKCPNHTPCTSAIASSKPLLSSAFTLTSPHPLSIPSPSPAPTCSLTQFITHPLTTYFSLLAAFTLLVYGLYLLTPNLRRPKQKPLRSTPLLEYNRGFDRLVGDLRRVVELGRHEEVVREYERCERVKDGRKEGFGTVEHVGEILEGLRSLSVVRKVRDKEGSKKQKRDSATEQGVRDQCRKAEGGESGIEQESGDLLSIRIAF